MKHLQTNTLKSLIFVISLICYNMISFSISSQDIQEELFGEIDCAGGNDISVVLFNKRDKQLGFITYEDSQAQVNISTQLIADKKIQLFMDYISFKVDL